MAESNILSDIIKKKLTKVESFLVKAKIDADYWEKSDMKDDFFLDSSHITGISNEPIQPLDDKRKVIVNFSLLRKLLLYFKRNNITDSIALYFIEEGPLVVTDGEIYGNLAPRIEDEDDV